MSEAKEGTVAQDIIRQLIDRNDKEDNSAYRIHIQELIKNRFFYIVATIDGCSLSITGSDEQAAEWRNLILTWHKETLSKRVTGNDEEAYESKGSGDGKGYL